MKTYEVKLEFVEHEGFEIPPGMRCFDVEGYDIEDAIREADMKLYKRDVTGYLGDFTVDNFDHDETACEMTVGDSERGWQVRYKITELCEVK